MVASAKALPRIWHLCKDGDWDYHLCNFAASKKYNYIGQYLRYKKIIGIKENCEVLIEIYVIWCPASFLDFGTSPFSKGCWHTGMEQGLAPNLYLFEVFPRRKFGTNRDATKTRCVLWVEIEILVALLFHPWRPLNTGNFALISLSGLVYSIRDVIK